MVVTDIFCHSGDTAMVLEQHWAWCKCFSFSSVCSVNSVKTAIFAPLIHIINPTLQWTWMAQIWRLRGSWWESVACAVLRNKPGTYYYPDTHPLPTNNYTATKRDLFGEMCGFFCGPHSEATSRIGPCERGRPDNSENLYFMGLGSFKQGVTARQRWRSPKKLVRHRK